MNRSPLYIGIDVGTQSTKALVLDERHQVVARASRPYPILPSDIRGRAEQDPVAWIGAVIETVQETMEALGGKSAVSRVKSISVSGQQHGMVCLDVAGQVLRPAKLWCDTESSNEADELSASGVFPFKLGPSFTASKLLWMKRKEPELFKKVKHLLLPSSYVSYWLTGEMRMDRGDASGTAFLDLISREWDPSCGRAVDESVLDMLPLLIDPNEPISNNLTIEASQALFRLDYPAPILTACGSGDNACAALGCGVIHPNQLVVSLGTSGTVFSYSDEPVMDPSGTVAPFCDATGHYLPLICTLNCTSVLSEVSEGFGQDHEALSLLAESVHIGCQGATFLPYLVGERTPNWPSSTGVLFGIRPGTLASPGLVYRAAMEGVTFGLLSGFRSMKGGVSNGQGEVFLVGGGANNSVWRQMVADVFQMHVRVPEETESAALGAALQGAAVFHKVPIREFVEKVLQERGGREILVQPRVETAAAYEDAYSSYQKLSSLLFAS